MTVSYQYDVASSSTGGFFRLLWRWRGSIWKLLYKELFLFLTLYILIALSYDYLMSEYYKRYFERIVIFCSGFVELIPLSFILGFYVSFTATRWWQQYTAIPWPDKLMNIIALYVPGSDETSRILRRTLMRYLNLTLVLVLRSISIPVKRRFPTKDHLIEAGFMTKPELEMYSSVPSHEFNTFWIPCTWFVNLLREAKSECRITDSGGLKLIMEEFNDFRSKCGLLWSYDWVSIPLVYTQVVTLSTQAFFLASLLGRQHIAPATGDKILVHQYGEYYFPIFTLLQFILYMGLLKLGEQLINPFGDDDEDFELNWIIDRHVKVSFLGVDILNSDPPPLMKDQYFDEIDIKLPYTEAAVAHKVKTYRGSVAAYNVPMEKHALVIPEFEDEQNNGSDDDNSTIQSSLKHSSQKSSVWTVFGTKRHPKLNESQSIPSLDSETMVESGVNPLWQGSVGSVDTQQTDMTTVTTGYGTDRSSQGIRGSWEDRQKGGQEFIINIPAKTSSQTTGSTTRVHSQMGSGSVHKPSITSIIDVPLLHGPTHSYGPTPVRKDSIAIKPGVPMVAISSDIGTGGATTHGPLSQSAQQIISERVVDMIAVQRSHSSVMRKVKVPKSSIFKSSGNRKVDSHIRIRPFKSRVTFSEDTKPEDKSSAQKLVYFIPKPGMTDTNSSSELSEIMDQKGGITADQLRAFAPTHIMLEIPTDTSLSAGSIDKRRQSLDPSLILIPAPSEPGTTVAAPTDPEHWLHHQSLPNIQEGLEEEVMCATTTGDGLIIQTSPSLIRRVSVKRHTSDRTTERRRSFKRQSCSTEPEPPVPSAPPPTPTSEPEVIVDITDDNMDQLAATESAPDSESAFRFDLPFKKKRKDAMKPRQSSTESGSSYHTANSFLMQISEDREDFLNNSNSSMDSYTSALDVKLYSDPKPVPQITFTEPTTPSNTSLATTSTASSTASNDQQRVSHQMGDHPRIRSRSDATTSRKTDYSSDKT